MDDNVIKRGWKLFAETGNANPLYQSLFDKSGKMTKSIDDLFRWYTQGGANEISDALNMKLPLNQADEVLAKASRINSLMNNVPLENRYTGPLYRGISAPRVFGEKDIHKMRIGDYAVSDVPVSFTQNFAKARDTFANPLYPERNIIAVPRSNQGVTIGPMSSFRDAGEREVLMPKGTGYEITGIHEVPETPNPLRIIQAKEIPNFNAQAARSMGKRVWSRGLKAIVPLLAAAGAVGMVDDVTGGGIFPDNAAEASMEGTDANELARILFAETKDLDDARAIASVIRNRVKAGKFGKGVTGVLHKPYQFSGYKSKEYNKTFDPRNMSEAESRIFNQMLKIANEYETMPDVTGGATHYFNPKLVKPSWASKMSNTHKTKYHSYYKE